MSTYSEINKQKAPLRRFVLPVSAWADDYMGKPDGEVAVGLRLLSEQDIQTIRGEATKYAREMHRDAGDSDVDHEARIETFNDTLMRWVAGRACCDPNDIRQPFFKMQEDTTRFALTSDGTRLIYDHYDRFRAEESPALPVITDEEILDLAELLDGGALSVLPTHRKTRLGRLLKVVFDELVNLNLSLHQAPAEVVAEH